MEKRNKELLIAKIETLQSSVNDSAIGTLCDILLDMVKASNGEDIGFKSK